MKITTLLFVLCSTFGFAQTRFTVNYNTNVNGKDAISTLEHHIPDTYDRKLEEDGLSFSTVVDYEISLINSILESINIYDAVITKERSEFNATPKVGGNNCEQAMQLCNSSSVPGNSGGFGTQELPNNNTVDGCLSIEHQSSWYYLNIQTAGDLVMRINPDDNNDDYDFAIWGPFTTANVGANCPPVTSPIRCSYSGVDGNTGMMAGAGDDSEGSGGNGWVNSLPVLANRVYILLIDNFSASSEGYNINFNWGGNNTTAVIGCTPVVLPVGLSEFNGLKVDKQNVLTWTTETEQNNDFFTLQWSASGLANDWHTLQTIEGAGDSEIKKYYSAVHSDYRQNSLNYYRLTQTDFNGEETVIEKIVAIDNKIEEKQVNKVINLLGQEVSINEKGIVIVIYEDGSQQKRFNQ